MKPDMKYQKNNEYLSTRIESEDEWVYFQGLWTLIESFSFKQGKKGQRS